MSFAEDRAWLSGMNPNISLAELFPRSFDRWRTLPIFGNHLNDLVHWLQDRSYSSASVRNHLSAFPKVVRWLQRKGVKSLAHLSEQELRLAYDYYRSREPNVGSVHILNRFFSERGIIAEGEPPPRSPTELELDHFAQYLCGVRGLVMSTVAVHMSRLRCFLQFLGFDQNPDCLRGLEISQIEAFLHRCAKTNNRYSMQHVVATLRAYLRRFDESTPWGFSREHYICR